MLIGVWERLRGYDKWTSTVANVQSSTLTPISFGDDSKGAGGSKNVIGWQSVCAISWEDQHQTRHTASFEVFEESPLYQLRDGDTVKIRFNPDEPAQFYLPGLLQSQFMRSWKMGVWAALATLVLIAFLMAWFGPNILNAFSH